MPVGEDTAFQRWDYNKDSIDVKRLLDKVSELEISDTMSGKSYGKPPQKTREDSGVFLDECDHHDTNFNCVIKTTQLNNLNSAESFEISFKKPSASSQTTSTSSNHDCGSELHEATYKDDTESIIRLFKDESVCVDMQNENGETALFLAVLYGRLKVADMLLCNHCDVNICDDFGNTPLHEATRAADHEMVKLLLEKGRCIDVNIQNEKGETSLHLATAFDYEEIADALLKAGASPNVRDGEGRSPLLTGLNDGSKTVCRKLLLHCGSNGEQCDVNVADYDGKTAFYYAVHSPYLDDVSILELLVKSGCDLKPDASWIRSIKTPDKFYKHPNLWSMIFNTAEKQARSKSS